MKKITLICFSLLFFTACNRSRNLEFQTYTLHKEVALTNEENSPKGEFEIKIDLPVSFKPKKDLKLLKDFCLWYTLSDHRFEENIPVDTMLSIMINDKITDYLAENKKRFENQKTPFYSQSFSRVDFISGTYRWYNNRILVYDASSYVFTGGAHGRTKSHTIMIDLKKMDFADLYRFLDLVDLDRIDTLLKEQYAKDKGFSTVEELAKNIGDEWFENISTSNAYAYLNYEQSTQTWFLAWRFDEYKIGPHAEGQPEIQIEVSKLNPLLQSKLKSWMSSDGLVVNEQQ